MSQTLNENMSPLALYIDQVISHMPVSPSQDPKVTLYPPSPQNSQIFSSFRSAPTLDKSRTNRVLIYPGAFNPPHRGHIHLLKHVFMRSAHDLNIIAAIILPSSDESVAKKVRREGGYFMFGRQERGLLWKQDLCFPSWAWVYEDGGRSFMAFLQRLSQATEKDGYSLEYVPLYGPQIGSPSSPPDPAFGCKILIMSDAARAAKFQRSSGRLRDFSGCTKWRRAGVDEEDLRRHAKAKASYALQAMKTISLPEAHSMLTDGTRYVKDTTETTVAKALEELKAVLTCQRSLDNDQTFILRFVKCEDIEPRKHYHDISSTIMRKTMREQKGVKLKEALDWMALSADLLWQCRTLWSGKHKLGMVHCINFQLSTEDPEEPPSSGESESSDDQPPLKRLKICNFVEASPSIEGPPPLEDPPPLDDPPPPKDPPHEASPSFEEVHSPHEPQSQDQHLDNLDQKRRSPETRLEAEVEIRGPPG